MDNKDFNEQFNFKEFETFDNFDFDVFSGFDMNMGQTPKAEPEEEKGFFAVFKKIMGKEEPKAEVKSEDPFKMDFDFDFDFSMPEMPPMDMGSFGMDFPEFEAFPGIETEEVLKGKRLETEHRKAAAEAKRIERQTRAAEKAALRAGRREKAKAEGARHREEYIPKIGDAIAKQTDAFGVWLESGKESWTKSWEDFGHENAARKEDRLSDRRNRELLLRREEEVTEEKTYVFSDGLTAVKSRAQNAYYTWAVVWDQLDEEKELRRTDRLTRQHNRENRVH